MSTKTLSAETRNGSPKPYKRRLLKARELRKYAAGKNYDRTKLLVAVFDDREFRADNGNADDLAAAAILDAEIEDLGLEFLQARALLEYFPDRQQWASGLLVNMYQELLDGKRIKVTTEAPKQKRNSATLAELEETQRQSKHWEARASFLGNEVVRLKNRIAELEEENAGLRAELAEVAVAA